MNDIVAAVPYIFIVKWDKPVTGDVWFTLSHPPPPAGIFTQTRPAGDCGGADSAPWPCVIMKVQSYTLFEEAGRGYNMPWYEDLPLYWPALRHPGAKISARGTKWIFNQLCSPLSTKAIRI